MKNSYISLWLFAIAFLGVKQINAQDSIDVGVMTIATLNDNEDILPGMGTRTLGFTVNNYGTTVVTGDDFELNFAVNGTSPLPNNIGLPANLSINPGESSNLTLNQAIDLIPLLQAGANSFCVYTVPAGTNIDTDMSNDTNCITLNYDPNTNIDLGAQSIEIVAPSAADNRYEIGTSITEVNLSISNESNIVIPAGNRIPYTLAIGNTTFNIAGTLQNDLAPSATTNRTVSNPDVIPSVPQTPGDYRLCVITNLSSDNVASNDTSCVDIEAYDPNNTGIEEVNDFDRVSAYFSNHRIYIDLNTTQSKKIDVFVHNIAGQLVTQKTQGISANTQQRIELSAEFTPGIYVVSVTSNGNILKTQKIAVR